MPKKQWTKSVALQWNLFLPPTRPSLSELAIFEKYLLQLKRRKKHATVAILGSTPEYRDLCQTYNVMYKCIDYSKQNFVALKEYMCHKDTADNLIIADWRDMKFEDKFDLWMGDLFTTVTPIEDHERIWNNIKRHSKFGSKILCKVALRDDNHRLNHKDIFKIYRKKRYYLNPFAAVQYEVLLSDYDFKEDTMYCEKSLYALKKSFREGIITRYEFEEFKKRLCALGDFKMCLDVVIFSNATIQFDKNSAHTTIKIIAIDSSLFIYYFLKKVYM